MVTPPSSRDEYRGFAAHYETEIAPFLSANEDARQKAVFRAAIISIIVAVTAVASFMFGPFGEGNFHLALIIAAIGGSGAWALVSRTRSKITDGLLSRICAYFEYSYDREISRPDFVDAFDRLDLLPSYNRQEWEDRIAGERNGASFSFCEAHLKRRSGGRKKRTKTVFRGQIFMIDYHKEFLGETIVKRDRGVLNRLMKPGKEFRQVGIVSAKFEKIFEAWSTDQVEARELLDPVVLERFEELDRLFDGAKLRAAFSRGKLYLALENGDKINMGSMFTPLNSAARVEKILKEFDLLFDLIDVISKRLENRIDNAFSIDAVRTSSVS